MEPYPMSPSSRFLVFTDIDGTLVEAPERSFDTVRPTAKRLGELGIPIVLCSSKTFSEQLNLQESFGVSLPCIVENGSAIATPARFWRSRPEGTSEHDGWNWLSLGLPSGEIRRRLRRVESEIGESLGGFGTMATEDVATQTGLDLVSARRAQAREFSETLALSRPEAFWSGLDPLFAAQGLSCALAGRFRTVVSSACDKGKAVRKFVAMVARDTGRGDLLSIGLGDGPGDRDLLRATHVSYQVMNFQRGFSAIDAADVVKISEVGPRGWVKAISALIGSPSSAPQAAAG